MFPLRHFASSHQAGRGHRPAVLTRRLPGPRSAHARGFTLVELLVAIAVMAVLSLMSWQAIDGMYRTQTVTRERADALAELQGAVGQWVADMDAVVPQTAVPAIDFDGRVLRLVRSDPLHNTLPDPSLRVVAWTRLSDSERWARWQSPPQTRLDGLLTAWQQASQWAQGERDSAQQGEVRLMPVLGWELFYFRDNAWANPLSASGNTTATGTASSTNNASANLPDGVRLVLQLPPDAALPGRLQRDWARPQLTQGRS